MDISSLPDEMLLLVLKRNSFATNFQLRKMNARIDKIARRTDFLTRVPVKKFGINQSTVHVVIRDKDAVELYIRVGKRDFSIEHNENNVDVLRMWLPRVLICEALYFAHLDIKEELFDLFSKNWNGLRHLTDLRFYCLDFQVPIVPFFTKLCPKLTKSFLFECTCNIMGNLFDNQEYRNRNWDSIMMYGSFLLENEFLLDLAPNCKDLDIPVTTNFTLSGAITMFKHCLADKTHNKQSIKLGRLKLGNVPIDQIKEFVETELPGALITYNRETERYKVADENVDKEIHLSFKINV